jgi:hypothetical protein
VSEALVAQDLQRAASYRLLSLLFQTPSEEVGAEIGALADVVEPTLREDAAVLARVSGRDLQGLYHMVLGASGRVPDVECAYDTSTAAGRGPLIADVAGFYKAFGYEAPAPGTADHIASELGFMGWLAMKAAYARHAGEVEHLEVTEDARAKFLRDHLGRWARPFLERLGEAGEGTHYEAVAVLASRTLRTLEGETAFAPPERRAHLPVVDASDDDDCG